MADFETINRTIGGVDDQRIIVDNVHSPLVRTMSIGDNWSKIRVVARISISATATVLAAPTLSFGLCSGTSAPPGSGTPNHFLGFEIGGSAASWVFTNSGGVDMLGIFANAANWGRVGKIENGARTFTNHGAPGGAGYIPNIDEGSCMIFFEITKGVSYSLALWGTLDTTPILHTIENFKNLMQMPDPLSSVIGAPINLRHKMTGTVSVDEGTYGALDTICFTYAGVSEHFEISDIAYSRLAV